MNKSIDVGKLNQKFVKPTFDLSQIEDHSIPNVAKTPINILNKPKSQFR